MQVILLCAGISKRMQPISDKVLLSFCGKTLLEHQIEAIHSMGWSEFIIVANIFNKDAIYNICKNIPNITFTIVEQKILEDGMKGAIEACSGIIKKDAFIVNSNDIVENFAFEKIKELSQKNDYQAIICGKVVKNYFPGGYLSKDQNGYMLDIVEKPGEGNEPSNLVNIVLHYFKNFQKFEQMLKSCENSIDDAYEKALKIYAEQEKVFIYEYNGYWQAIKYPWHILDVQNFFLRQQSHFIHPSAQVSDKATIKGNVYIDADVKVFENAVISGPCYIGKGSVIANNALVRESHIGKQCVIGFSTEIARSYIHNQVWTHSNYIGDSVIDSNTSFGAGTITGNLRLDEKNIMVNIQNKKIDSGRNKLGAIIGSGTRIGIHCSINPGIKIGKDCFLTSSLTITEDIHNNSFVSKKEELIVKENKISIQMEERNLEMLKK